MRAATKADSAGIVDWLWFVWNVSQMFLGPIPESLVLFVS